MVELKKICQDTKRHIIETERMIEDVRQTSESISTSSTHKALVGGDKHTILEGQYFLGVGNHPQVRVVCRHVFWSMSTNEQDVFLVPLLNICVCVFFLFLLFKYQVPRYLRWNGNVRKRGIQKGELWSLTDRVWKARIRQRKAYDDYLKEQSDKDQNTPTTSSSSSSSSARTTHRSGRGKKKIPKKPETLFADFFYNWLFRKHKSHQLVVEWGYNVMAGLEIYMWDAHLELFLLCLTGAVTEGKKRIVRQRRHPMVCV